jgi:hypothetical protein
MRSFSSVFVKSLVLLTTFGGAAVEAQPNTIATLGRIASATDESHARYFFHDIRDSISFFMQNPDQIKIYSRYTYNHPTTLAVASAPLCQGASGLPESSIVAYNESPEGSSQRKNLWLAIAACLAAHEGAEYFILKRADLMNKLDSPEAKYRKFVYGVFQVSTERGAAVHSACEPAWKKFATLSSESGAPDSYLTQQRSIPYLNDLCASGTESTASSLAALGSLEKQRFNILCGVHEIYRAATTGEANCMDPFFKSQNRYGPLRRQSAAFQKCVNQMVPALMDAGDDVEVLRRLVRKVAAPK